MMTDAPRDVPAFLRSVSRDPRQWRPSIFAAMAAISGIALTATSGWLIVRAAQQPPILTLMVAIVGVRAFGMARVAFGYASRVTSHDAALAQLARARVWMYQRLVPLTPARLGQRNRAAILAGAVDDLSEVSDASVRVSVPIRAAVIAALTALALTIALLPQAGTALAVFLIASALLLGIVGRTQHSSQRELTIARSDVRRRSSLIAAHSGELAAIGGRDAALQLLEDAQRRLRAALSRQGRLQALTAAGILLLTGIATSVTALILRDADLDVEIKALLLLVPVAFADTLGGLAEAMTARARAAASARQLAELLQLPPAVADVDNDVAVVGDGTPHLRLSAVTAAWSEHARTAVGPIDLDLPPGSKVAITGDNGSGKSTLLAVLARHLDPRDGRIDLDGVDVRTMPIDRVRAQIAVVDDEPHIFATSVRENLRIALAHHARSDGDGPLVAGLHLAGLGDWFAQLPAGLDTRLGFGGRGVSGGERARLAIARALIADRPVILLDEATAHLDLPTAEAVLADLFAAAQERTVVMVTHREHGLHHVDRVLELAGPAYSVR